MFSEDTCHSPFQVEIPRAFVCAESKIFDVSEWAICQVSAFTSSYVMLTCVNLLFLKGSK